MGRPRYGAGDTDARGKIAEAFWELLAERPCSEISVLEVARRAAVNKNTFYYHFANIDDMTAEIVEQSIDPAAFTRMIANIDTFGADTVGPDDARLQRTYERFTLIAGTHSSPALRQILKDAIGRGWCETFGIDLSAASFEDEVSFQFTLGGVLSIMGMHPAGTDVFTFRQAMSTALRDEVVQRLQTIARHTRRPH